MLQAAGTFVEDSAAGHPPHKKAGPSLIVAQVMLANKPNICKFINFSGTDLFACSLQNNKTRMT